MNSFQAKWTWTKHMRLRKVPAHSLRVKVPSLSVVNHNNFMMFIQEALKGWLWRPGDIASVTGSVTGPPESITLTVLLGKDQQNLEHTDKSTLTVVIILRDGIKNRPLEGSCVGSNPSSSNSFPCLWTSISSLGPTVSPVRCENSSAT